MLRSQMQDRKRSTSIYLNHSFNWWGIDPCCWGRGKLGRLVPRQPNFPQPLQQESMEYIRFHLHIQNLSLIPDLVIAGDASFKWENN